MDLLPRNVTFHPGRMPDPTPAERRRRRRQHQVQNQTTAIKPFRPAPSWFLLPPSAIDPAVQVPICFAGMTLTSVIKTLESYMKQPPLKFNGPSPIELPPNLGRPSKRFIQAFREAIFKNMNFRAKARKLLLCWLRRRLRAANDVDPVTCEAPRQPITLVDWSNRSTYSFEAQTIYKDMVGRLTLHDEVWPTPQRPRNPYTNLPLTLAQLYSVTNQLRAIGRSHWTLDALAQTSYNFVTFARNFSVPLKHSALNQLFRNPKSDEYQYVMTDFMENEHDHHDQHYNASLYKWALVHEPDSQILMNWRRACRRYHELTLLHTDPIDLRNHLDDEISPMTEGLCGPPRVLQVLREQWHRQQLCKAKQKNTIVSSSTAADGSASGSI
jgi:hypothetical protein